VLRAAATVDYFDISKSVSFREEIIEKYFLDLMYHGKLLPGDVFSETEISRSSGCNTITVWEYLIKFSHFGLIKKNPRAKWQMVEFDEEFALELVECRRIFEFGAITDLLAVPTNNLVWAELELLLDEHLAVLRDVESRYGELVNLDRKLHNLILKSSDNRFYLQFFEVISLICHYHYRWDKSDELARNKIALEEHVAIISNLIARNTLGILAAMETHLNTAKQTLLRSALQLSNKT